MIRYTYDRQGNMLREKSMKSGEEKKYSYDSFGHMVRAEVPVESPGTREFQVQINRYDAEGLRHEMEENGRLIKFLYNEDREVVAEETSNGTITRYIRGFGIISSDSEEAKTYYHYVSDAQGSITHVLSEDAEILNHYSYDAFGNIIEKTEQVENRFCYNGEMLDPVTQQYYLRARFYNPVIGRFTQEDTYYGDGLNLYQYCQANPVGYVDPSGHTCEIVQNHYKQYQEYRKQHPKANAAEAYEAVTGKNPLKKDAGKSGTTSTKRPSWRQSELDAAKDFPEYLEQKSFLKGEEVPYGTKGSVRPDLYKDGFSIDVKNYKAETASGRSNLARNIEKQYYQRIDNLPAGTKQSVLIDTRGQNVSQNNLNTLYNDIMERTNNGIKVRFKTN